MATGEHGTATKLGEFDAENFDKAVEKMLEENPSLRSSYDYSQNYITHKWSHRIWACRLFDNEAEARVSFG